MKQKKQTRYTWKYISSVLIALILTLSMFSAAFGSPRQAEVSGLSDIQKPSPAVNQAVQMLKTLAEEKTERMNSSDFYSNFSESMLRQEAGMNWKEWDAETKTRKQRGKEQPMSLMEVLSADPDMECIEEDGAVFFLSGDLPLTAADALAAYESIYRLLPALNARPDAELVLSYEVHAGDYRIYLFQEFFEGQSVPGSTARMIVQEDGAVKAVVCSLARKEPVSTGREVVDASAAEAIVLAYLQENGMEEEILDEYTEQIVIIEDEEKEEEPEKTLSEDLDRDSFSAAGTDAVKDIQSGLEETDDSKVWIDTEIIDDGMAVELLRWVVYSKNPDYHPGSGDSRPYLAHVLSADGTCLNSFEVKEPGDEAGQNGTDAVYLFDRMEPAEWTGEVTDIKGKVRTLTVPVMRDRITGEYVLGDAERRIVTADFSSYAYEDETLELIVSEDNTGWRDDDLLTYANVLTVWDYYAEMGWTGVDGIATPILLLRDMCFENGIPMDNAAYVAKVYGWQLIAYDNTTYGLGEALDVIAHEFSHGVTGTVQGANPYFNDYGAINESLSDIMACICEAETEQTGVLDWLIGEDTAEPMRSMLDPHAFNQPEYVWDIFYTPSTNRPNDINDRGGVHSNSSILNLLSARLITEYGMSLEEAKRFWMMTICVMTSMTDLAGMSPLMSWSLHASENGVFEEALSEQTDLCRLALKDLPLMLPEGQRVVTLQLPDTETMRDPYWIVQALQFNTDSIGELLATLLFKVLGSMESAESEGTEDVRNAEDDNSYFGSLISQYSSWASDDTGTVTMVTLDHPTLYTMMNLDPETLNFRGFAVLAGNRWVDVSGMMSELSLEQSESVDDSIEAAMEQLISVIVQFGEEYLSGLLSTDGEEETVRNGDHVTLSNAGLEQVQLTQIPVSDLGEMAETEETIEETEVFSSEIE